jgi:hypothetical protein
VSTDPHARYFGNLLEQRKPGEDLSMYDLDETIRQRP